MCVAAAAAHYGLWLAGATLTATSGARVVAGTVLGLGIGASAFAVVPGFEELLRCPPKTYLAVTSALGLVALVTGIMAVVSPNEGMVAILVGATVLLWVIATVRHVLAARAVVEPPVTKRLRDSEETRKVAKDSVGVSR